MNKNIKVTGSAKLSVKPDVIVISMKMIGLSKDYNQLLNDSNSKLEELKNSLMNVGFDKKDLKTKNFNISTEYETYKVNDVYKKRFKGYAYYHELALRIDADNKVLGNALNAIVDSQIEPEFSISYGIKNSNDARNDLLKKAMDDCKDKAEIIASATGLKIVGVNNVDYSWTNIDIYSEPMDYEVLRRCSINEPIDIEPDIIEVSDTVTVMYEVE